MSVSCRHLRVKACFLSSSRRFLLVREVSGLSSRRELRVRRGKASEVRWRGEGNK